uniref:EGF-like domain-containing protein n=1 Tax=Trichobilharzia regenti TaxID=157069 RepID=A0AA85KN43_TRIRE|nr:unnamed protein product [Trichobilharzia regenti]
MDKNIALHILLIIFYSLSLFHVIHGLTSHVCDYYKGQPVCCPGWRNGIGAPCVIPVCAGNCGERGECIKPNTCICSDRRVRFSCKDEDDEEDAMQLDQAENQCPDNCNRRGVCENGKCTCQPGYSGQACNVKLKGACYTSLKRGLCVNPMQYRISQYDYEAIKLTHEVCCNALGIAWGEPCQTCHTTHCGKGFEEIDGVCKDINECEVDGVCQRGQCVNEEGSYKCNCPENTYFDKTALECVYIQKSPCESDPYRCNNGGKCIDLPSGDYKCVCPWGTKTSQDKRSCLQDNEPQFDICQLYKSSVCKNGQCIPRGTSYECICNEGFEPSEDRKTCQYKIDICSIHRGYLCTNGHCIPTGRDFFCECNPGFTLSYDRRRCINKCEELGPSVCPNGYCIALSNGDYECQCDIGYQSTSDRKKCILPMDDSYSNSHYAKSMNYYKNKYYESEHETFNSPIDKSMEYSEHDDGKNDNWWQNDHLQGKPFNLKQKSYTQYKQQDSAYTKYAKPTALHLRGISRRSTPCGHDEIASKCNGGICLNLGGDGYMCECLPGYKLAHGGRECVKPEAETNSMWQNDASTNDVEKIPAKNIDKTSKYTSHPTKLIDISHINSMMKSSPCSRNDILDKCEWGTCLNLGGDLYKCDCLSNYQYSQTEGCIPKTQTDKPKTKTSVSPPK